MSISRRFSRVLCCLRFILLLKFVTLCNGQACRPQEFILVNDRQVFNITSPNYPRPYTPGSSCQYRVVAPLDHIVVLNCLFELSPTGCSGTQFFQISRDGDYEFRDGESYCSGANIPRTSHYRVIAFGYRSTGTQQQGRFICQAFARRQTCDCGWTQATKITNGQEAARLEFPSMVALRDVTSIQRIYCGGSIISHRFILTAAHCIRTQPDARQIVAHVGDHDLSSATESRFAIQHRIQSIISHPGYIANTNSNDIALLITVTNIEWSRGVGPICLPYRQASESFTYINVDVTGWGTLSFAGSKSNTLQKAALLTIDNRACQVQYNSTILPSQLCTYDFRGLGQDSCQYDSGGPVLFRQQRMFLIGIISFGRTCGARYGIGVNTRITTHLNWIYGYVGAAACIL